MGETATPLGWWAMSGDAFMRDLQRVADGESPFLVYAEAYANAFGERVGCNHDFSVPSSYHDEGAPLFECSRCGEVNA